jgi:hypothetical protein
MKGSAITIAALAPRFRAMGQFRLWAGLINRAAIVCTFAVDVAILVVGRELFPVVFSSRCRDTSGRIRACHLLCYRDGTARGTLHR